MSNIQIFYLNVDEYKWKELLKSDDLRFFKHIKNVAKILQTQKQIILKRDHWNNKTLKEDYILSNKYNHINLVKHICYFEYEEDIINFLSNDDKDKREEFEDNSVIISPYYMNLDFDSIPEHEHTNIMQQIILILYLCLFEYKLSFHNINMHNVYIHRDNTTKIHYTFNKKSYKIQSQYIVKIDAFIDACELKECLPIHYRFLYNNIITLTSIKMHKLREFVESFIGTQNDNKIVNPIKILDQMIWQTN